MVVHGAGMAMRTLQASPKESDTNVGKRGAPAQLEVVS